ncbi:MAG: hypothetical protein Q9O74_05065 [Planctomycetota bacterium]|nr:hypothetical protein [Planctomycetota bacterium]
MHSPPPANRFIPADYLPDQDIACHECGYNLRGCRETQCPECGTVIPRPSAKNVNPQQAFRCFTCGYELGATGLSVCPECGSDDVVLGARNIGSRLPPFRWRRKLALLTGTICITLIIGWVLFQLGL